MSTDTGAARPTGSIIIRPIEAPMRNWFPVLAVVALGSGEAAANTPVMAATDGLAILKKLVNAKNVGQMGFNSLNEAQASTLGGSPLAIFSVSNQKLLQFNNMTK